MVCAETVHRLRLCQDLNNVKASMNDSYKRFASFVTEMKMEHDNGQKESDKLTELLGHVPSVQSVHI